DLAQVHRNRDPDLIALVALYVVLQPRLEHHQAPRLRLHRDVAPREHVVARRLGEFSVASTRADRVGHHDAAAILGRFDVVTTREQAPIVRVLGFLRTGLEDVDPRALDLETPRRQPQRLEKRPGRADYELLELVELGGAHDLYVGLVVRGRHGLLGRRGDVALRALGPEIRGHLAVDRVA